jgi:hypothetical protein
MGYLCRLASIAALLTLLPAPAAPQGDSATLQVVRVIDGDRDSSDAREVNALEFCVSYSPDLPVKGFVDVEDW